VAALRRALGMTRRYQPDLVRWDRPRRTTMRETSQTGRRRWLGAFAALGALVSALALVAPATAQQPSIIGGEVPAEGFALLTVQTDATPAQVVGALQEQACSPVSLAITVSGKFVTYV